MLLQELKADRSDQVTASIARAHLRSYVFPVMMILSRGDGVIVHAMNANDLLDMGAERAQHADPASLLQDGYVAASFASRQRCKFG